MVEADCSCLDAQDYFSSIRYLNFVVRLSSATTQPVTVSYLAQPYGGSPSANVNQDFGATSGTLTIPAGATSRTVQVRVYADHLTEADERLVLRLTNASGATFPGTIEGGTPGTFLFGTIVDDD